MVLMNDIFIITLQFIIYDTSMYASIKNLLAKLLLVYPKCIYIKSLGKFTLLQGIGKSLKLF